MCLTQQFTGTSIIILDKVTMITTESRHDVIYSITFKYYDSSLLYLRKKKNNWLRMIYVDWLLWLNSNVLSPWCIMGLHGTTRYHAMGYHGVPWGTMGYHGVPCTMYEVVAKLLQSCYKVVTKLYQVAAKLLQSCYTIVPSAYKSAAKTVWR